MTLPNLYFRRKRLSNPDRVDVYQYENVPYKLRVQIVQVLQETLGQYHNYGNNKGYWDALSDMMRREKGVFHLSKSYEDPDTEYCSWLLAEEDLDCLITGIELSLRVMIGYRKSIGRDADGQIAEVNARMLEAGFGFEFVSNEMVQVDNYVLHSEVVVPALTLISDPTFKSANDEYLSAHEAFRKGEYEDAVVDCGKAFESVLKIIGAERSWPISTNDTVGKLVAAAFSTEFIPSYMQTQFTGLRSLLDSGIGTVRNKMGAHGAGSTARQLDKHLAAYQLHQTAAAIVFLVTHHSSEPE
ncbi:STM4504/CBY_0614 family protein [uncultured Sphingomonas sp.]|uniref:STM4504/CBY_0614 family protein n=1 Tax=uncultured Sphingomonas sp. TaxID=158754 RepID=UPI0025DF00B7|nr:hypothetical protein [uncultured Sphingomonas sp.]